jgi:hypothetical protein
MFPFSKGFIAQHEQYASWFRRSFCYHLRMIVIYCSLSGLCRSFWSKRHEYAAAHFKYITAEYAAEQTGRDKKWFRQAHKYRLTQTPLTGSARR